MKRPYRVNWSPNGKKIVFDAREVIYVVNADGTGLTELVFGSHPQWIPS